MLAPNQIERAAQQAAEQERNADAERESGNAEYRGLFQRVEQDPRRRGAKSQADAEFASPLLDEIRDRAKDAYSDQHDREPRKYPDEHQIPPRAMQRVGNALFHRGNVCDRDAAVHLGDLM